MRFVLAVFLGFSFISVSATAQELDPMPYDIGHPSLTDFWVDPVNGLDTNSGESAQQAFKTVKAAWLRVPQDQQLTKGYRIILRDGTYTQGMIPAWLAQRYGTKDAPIIFQAEHGRNAQGHSPVVFELGFDINLVNYIYLIGFDIKIKDPGGVDGVHCASCKGLLIRDMDVDVYPGNCQEAIKINQAEDVYIEKSRAAGGYWNSIDYVSVFRGHIIDNVIEKSGEALVMIKGGSAYHTVARNIIRNGGNEGVLIGQGTTVQFEVAPYLGYEAYNNKVINNVITDTAGAGLGVYGAYNTLMAHNTLFRVGDRSHMIQVVPGIKRNGAPPLEGVITPQQVLSLGGWTSLVSGREISTPAKNTQIVDNIVYNDDAHPVGWNYFYINGPSAAEPGTNVPNPVTVDDGLSIRGNIFWTKSKAKVVDWGLLAGACDSTNPTCTITQLQNDNLFNTLKPDLEDPDNYKLWPKLGGNLYSLPATFLAQDTKSFKGGDLASGLPTVPSGNLGNQVTTDILGFVRENSSQAPGAYALPSIATPTASPTNTPSPTTTPTKAPSAISTSVPTTTVTPAGPQVATTVRPTPTTTVVAATPPSLTPPSKTVAPSPTPSVINPSLVSNSPVTISNVQRTLTGRRLTVSVNVEDLDGVKSVSVATKVSGRSKSLKLRKSSKKANLYKANMLLPFVKPTVNASTSLTFTVVDGKANTTTITLNSTAGR